MTYVITAACVGTKDTACVQVCPVDCIHPRPNEDAFDAEPQLYIDPAECIDCGACVPVCPVSAIYAAGELPPEQAAHERQNADYYRLGPEEFRSRYG